MSIEVLVIGGGPAGLAAAIAAAQAGLSVMVAEPLSGAIDKCCGEGLLPPAVRALGLLGIREEQLAGVGSPLTGIIFYQNRQRASAKFGAGSVGFGVRRTALHTLLRQRALEAGVRVETHSVRMVHNAQVLMAGTIHRPRWVIGADGAQSSVRAAAALDAGSIVSRRFALRQHFQLASQAAAPADVEVYWAPNAQAYVTPAGDGRIGVAILAGEKLRSMAAALALFPALRDRLGDAESCSDPRGAVSYHRSLRRVRAGCVALVGDAAGSVDAVTGDGLSLAFQQALALGKALGKGDLGSYAHAHTRLLRPARGMSRMLLAMGSRPLVTSGAMLLLGHVPGLFAGLLRLHTHTPVSTSLFKESSPWQPAPISTRSTM